MEENKTDKPEAVSLHDTCNIYIPDREPTFDGLKFVCYMIERTARRIKHHSPICQQHDNYNCSAYYEPSYFITRACYQGNFN